MKQALAERYGKRLASTRTWKAPPWPWSPAGSRQFPTLELQIIRRDLQVALKDFETQPGQNSEWSWYADYLLDLRRKREEIGGKLARIGDDDPAKEGLAEDLVEAERRIVESAPNSLLGALIQMEQLVQWARSGFPAYAKGSIDWALKTLPNDIERLRRQREANAARADAG